MQTSAGLQDHILRTIVRPWAEIVGADLAGEGQRGAPLKDGVLRGSITHEVTETRAPARGVEIEVTAKTVYAAVQHEAHGDRDFHHPIAGHWHYLSDPLKQKALRYRGALQLALDNGRMPPGFGGPA